MKSAILLFGRQRIEHFPDAWIQCGRFFGAEKIDIFDHTDIDVPLPKALDEVMLFLKKHAFRGADLSEVRRKDVWSIPLGILREVLVNALVHSDYSQRGAPIRVVFLDDRIEVESMGILLPGLTVEEMKQGTSRIRNPVLARVFKELNLIEQWGTGVRRIFAEARELGLPEPKIEEIGMRLRFTVYLAEPHRIQNQPGLESGAESGVESDMAIQILSYLKDTVLSKSEIAKELGKTKPTRYLNDLMARLLQEGYVQYTIPDKPNSRLQKYRLTPKGRGVVKRRLGRERVSSFVTHKAPRYRPIMSRIPDDQLAVDPDISDKELDVMLHKQLAEIEAQLLVDGHDVMKPRDNETYPDYQARLHAYLKPARRCSCA